MSNFIVAVDTSNIIARLPVVKNRIHENVLKVMKKLAITAQREVMVKLSGQVLNVRTGTLRRSINQEVTDQGNVIKAIVGTNVKYAAIHEYGYQGPVNVQAHLRTIKEAFGKELKNPVTFQVREHVRTINMPERSFLRSTIREMETRIAKDINQAVRGAISNERAS